MDLTGQTIATGKPKQCVKCRQIPALQVVGCGDGYYIGTVCDCGPYTRESDHYGTSREANDRLRFGNYSRTY